jgi:glycosyltransferase involved in cell wall biosynthesis
VKKLKVAHVFQSLNFSGAEVMYTQAANLFQENGFELIAVSTDAKIGNYFEKFELSGYTVLHMPQPRLSISNLCRFILYFWQFYVFLKIQDVMVLHIHRSTNYWFYSLCGFLAGTKTIRTLHNVFKNRKITWHKAVIERFTARKLLNVTFQSIGESVFKNEADYYRNETIRINNWFDNKAFFPPIGEEEVQMARKELGLLPGTFVVISVGGCSVIKNHSDIIRALALLPKDIPFKYLHLGSGSTEGDEKQQAAELLSAGSVSFVGNTTEVRKYLISSDVFVMTSKFEGLSIASVEAMACRLPLILYDAPGLRDLIQGDNNGLLIKPSHLELATALATLARDPAKRLAMGANASASANLNFGLNVNVSKIIELYRADDHHSNAH